MPKTFQEALDSIIVMETPVYKELIKGSVREACESYTADKALKEILPHMTLLLDEVYQTSIEKSVIEQFVDSSGFEVIRIMENFTAEEKSNIVHKFQLLVLWAGLIYQRFTNFDDFILTLGEIAELVTNKQRDYGQGNILKSGIFGIAVRTNDKIERLKNLIAKNKEVVNEPTADSWRDIVGYSFVALLLLFGWFTLPIAEGEIVNEE